MTINDERTETSPPKDAPVSSEFAGDDVWEVLSEMIPDTPETRRAGKKEALRLMLTDAMREARQRVGMTQQDVADELGATQSWVSKLESANHDHQIESVLAYLDALGADLDLTIQLDGDPIPVQYTRLLDGD